MGSDRNDDGKIAHQGSPSTSAFFSSSIDEKSGLESEPATAAATFTFTSSLDEVLAPSCSSSLSLDFSTRNKQDKDNKAGNEQGTSIPVLKLRPRLPQRRDASIRHEQEEDYSKTSNSFKTPTSKIFFPFLSSSLSPPPSHSSLQQQDRKQKQQRQKPLQLPFPFQQPPLLQRVPVQYSVSSTTTNDDSPRSDQLQNQTTKMKRKKTKMMSTPSSPPLLVPSFDFGISTTTTTDTVVTLPPAIPHASLFTPPAKGTRRRAVTASIARPKAMRPSYGGTPPSYSHTADTGSRRGDHIPHLEAPIFFGRVVHNTGSSSSMKCPAFSFSSNFQSALASSPPPSPISMIVTHA